MPSQTRRGDNFGLGKESFPMVPVVPNGLSPMLPIVASLRVALTPSPVLTMPVSSFLLLHPAENRCL